MSMKEARAMVEGMLGPGVVAPAGLAAEVLARVGLIDEWAEIEGPIGPLYVAWSRDGIRAVERAGDPDDFETEYRLRYGRDIRRVPSMPSAMSRAVRHRLAGDRTRGPDVDLGTLTDFEQAVLRKTMEIPFGEVRPYSWVAREIGRPRAVRAVGSALAGNPVVFVIPCHRVVRADGRIGEYGAGGPEAKRAVLTREGVDVTAMERLAASGIRYTGSDTTGIYCYPSCHQARRITPVHAVHFRNAAEARDAGFRPCRICRPLEDTPFAA
jgi:O-6-methylguanine DNA methyltransferase